MILIVLSDDTALKIDENKDDPFEVFDVIINEGLNWIIDWNYSPYISDDMYSQWKSADFFARIKKAQKEGVPIFLNNHRSSPADVYMAVSDGDISSMIVTEYAILILSDPNVN